MFFSVARTIFFTVGQNYFRKKIQSINWPFFAELEKKFGIFTGLFTHDEETEDESKEKEPSSSTTSPSSSNFLLGKNWRDLIPVVKVSYSTHLKKTKFEIKICPLPQKWSRETELSYYKCSKNINMPKHLLQVCPQWKMFLDQYNVF